ncbi:jerky protein homolog-like [Eumetopias jubatus]|uniref:jerky protein homolog-like n=1 Tax=Eumetopias jubatus TaxID=34886 RepID=UPI0010163919|nr:jerky protein homolog-like [Eumetopias jubatus]
MEKMEKRLNLWIREMTTNKKNTVDSVVGRLKAKEIYSHVTQGQEKVKPFSASAGWLARFKRRYHMKNVKVAGKAGPADQEAAEEFKKYLLSIIHEKGYMEEQVFNAFISNEETTMMDYWKSVGIRNIIDYSSTAWDSIKQATINKCWGNVWPDCVKHFEGLEGVTENIKNSVENIMHIAQQISGEGFRDMREGDVEEILEEMAVEPTKKDLDEMAKRGTGVSDDDGDESQPKTPRIVPLTAAKISEWNSALEKIFHDMEECDPVLEHSLTLRRLTSTASVPYAETLKRFEAKSQADKAEGIFQASSGGNVADTITKL